MNDIELSDTITHDHTHNVHVPVILCFKEHTNVSPEVISQIEASLNCQISVLNNWPEFTKSLAAGAGQTCPTLILLDANIFKGNLSTIPEILNTVSTLHRCMGCTSKIAIGVTFDEKHSAEFIRELHTCGVLGIVPCNNITTLEKTIEAMSELLLGRPFWPKELVSQVTISFHSKSASAQGIHLTNRQGQVLSLVCNRGLSNKKIAASLKISESTVKIHVSAIMKAYGVRNRTQLALAASSSLHA